MRSLDRWLLVAGCCVVACSGDDVALRLTIGYPVDAIALRVGEAVAQLAPSGGVAPGAEFSVAPALPAGLLLDADTGALSGVPAVEQAPTVHVVTVRIAAVSASTEITLRVDPALPAAFESLAPGWIAELAVGAAEQPVRVAPSPDGRLFYCERQTGRVRVVSAPGELLVEPFATLPVVNDGHRGLLGLALGPDFGQRPELFVAVCTPADRTRPARLQVVRFDATGDVGTDAAIVVDDIPLAAIQVGGEIVFDAGGHLLLSVGDLQDPALAQDPSSPAGKVLRYSRDGAIPLDQPDPGSPVLCSGLRNAFALAVHAATGSVFAADNGPDRDDRLAFVQAGRNFGWGAQSPPAGAAAGFVVREWQDVVAPTGMAFRGDDLLITTYSDLGLLRLRLSGPARTDIDREDSLARFRPDGIANTPLCVRVGPDGSVWVTTFTAIWRLREI